MAYLIGNGTIYGTSGNDTIYGGNGDDMLYGGAGNDYIDGGFGFDVIDGGTGIDTTSYAFYAGPIDADLANGVVKFPGNTVYTDTLVSIENLIGTAGDDKITGSAVSNVLTGGAGNDTINGGGGNDKIYGGAGADTMTGGAGADKFIFLSTADSSAGSSRDVILDFANGTDKIDLSKIDANTLAAGNQAFTLIGSNANFTSAGQIKFVSGTAGGILYGDVNGDHVEDFSISLAGVHSVTASDFIL